MWQLVRQLCKLAVGRKAVFIPVASHDGALHNRSMRPSEALALHRTQIRQIALSHHALDIRVFGSALNGDDHDGSDLDLLVEPSAHTSLFDIGAIRAELKQLLGVEIDVLTPASLPEKFRMQVLRDAKPV
jgi:predicted nucleotidyltransferase